MTKTRWVLVTVAVLVIVLLTFTFAWGYYERHAYDDPKMDCTPGVLCY